jgi:two-component system chemotaxis response regulator CheY
MKLEDLSVLVVEDVLAMRTRLKDLCREIGFKQVTMAANGEEAKVVMAIEDVHLLLVDWYTEPMTGLELLRMVRTTPKFQNTSFLMVTAENTREKVIEALKSGVDDYLVKPLTAAQLQSKVLAVLTKRKVIG